jgi:ribosomal protein L16 Arg81 hydroxylase
MLVEDFDFEKIIYPISLDTFISDYWEKKPLIISREIPTYYQELFSKQALDSVLFFTTPKPPQLRVIKNQQEVFPDRYIKQDGQLNLNQLYKLYDEGNTLVVNGLHQLWLPLTILCRNLQLAFNHAVIANCYASPKQSKGLMPHYDTHDVFVLQIEGAKQWYVHEAPQPVPLLHSDQPIIPEGKLAEPLHSIYLKAGDLLYIPRGFIHHAATADSASSLHLTIGLYATQWFDLLIQALTQVSCQRAEFRQALPLGYLHRSEIRADLNAQFQLLSEKFCQEANFDAAIDITLENFIRQMTPVPDGHLSQVDNLDRVTLETIVAKRKGMVCRLVHQDRFISIQFPGNTIKGESHLQAALTFITDAEAAFSVGDLPDNLTDDGKIVLIRRLIRGGLLYQINE